MKLLVELVLRPCFSLRWSDQEKQGGGYKNACISKTVGLIELKTFTECPSGCALLLDSIVFMPTASWHACVGAKNGIGVLRMHFPAQNTENKERYNLECVDVLPECSYVVCMNVQFIFTVHPSFVHRKQESLETWVLCQSLPPMVYNDEEDSLLYKLEHNYLLNN